MSGARPPRTGRGRSAVCAGLVLALLAGCETGPIPVRLDNRPAPPRRSGAEQFALTLLPVLEERPAADGVANGETRLGGAVVTRDSLTVWIENEVRRQLSSSHAVVSAAAAPIQGAALRLRVAKCYARPLRGQVSAQVVLQAEWLEGAIVRDRQTVRGQRVGSIWWSAQPEVGSALRLALEEAVRQLHAPPVVAPSH